MAAQSPVIMGNSKQDVLLNAAAQWYWKRPEMLKILADMVEKRPGSRRGKTGYPSLRQLDYFVVTYSPHYQVRFEYVLSNGETTTVNVHKEYKENLSAYSKDQFDPFGRGKEIVQLNGV